MFKNALFLFACLVSSFSLNASEEFSEEADHLNHWKYQLVPVKDGTYSSLYLFDRSSGTVWRPKYRSNEWEVYLYLPAQN